MSNPITESNITLNFPDNLFFRFQDCDGYNQIKNHFKEMDVCWYDQANDTLYLLELKNWGDGVLNEENNPDETPEEIKNLRKNITDSRINILLKKSIDSVFMFISILLNKPQGIKIQACSPFTITNNTEIVLLSIINWSNSDTTYISSVNSSYKAKFKPYAKLLNIKKFNVITKNQARNIYNWVV